MKRIILAALILAFVFSVYAFIEPFWIQTKVLEFDDMDIPDSFKGIKIVFISDIHHKKSYPISRVKKLVKKVNKLRPDIILLGGDYISDSIEYIQPCFEELKKLDAIIGKYGVLGNHDHWESAALTREWMKKADIICLDNKSLWINLDNSRIKIGGVGDMWEDEQIIKNTINDVDNDDFVMLVSHNPDFVEMVKTDKVDLMLSGHTHGGQISLFGLWAPFVPSRHGNKYRTGIIHTKNTTLLVSNGIGNAGPLPVRFFVRPQINVIELK
jgi:predicted MPP superfamily phosphohydrolase